ncbi:MAG: polyphosphate kinase 1 [Acidobacteriota bacterium]
MNREARAKRRSRRSPDLFFNRELSWLAFNERVLEEAADSSNPLLERVKFAAISASNLDEFFMVRVARLKTAVLEGDVEPDPSGLTPAQQLREVSRRVHLLVERLFSLVNGTLLPALAEHGVRVARMADLDQAQRTALSGWFRENLLPALTPLAIDQSRPFPMLASLTLNLAVRLLPAGEGEAPRLAVVQVPARLPRLVRVPGAGDTTFVLLEDIIRVEFDTLFPGQVVLEAAAFRLTRDAELELDDEGGLSYLEAIQEELRRRRRNDVVRLTIESAASGTLLSQIADQVEVGEDDVYRVPGPIDLRVLFALAEIAERDELRDRPLKPVPVLDPQAMDRVFDVLDECDILVHHPYDSFDPVAALVERAADDPDVLAIKLTLYRTSGDSPIVRSLMRAADQGKQVTAVVELMARFDEERNIQWAQRLEEAGAHVIYGIKRLKVHSKIALVVRRGPQGIRRYVHLGTGNYNDRTARQYTDMGLLTSSHLFGIDASAFFNALTGYSDPPRMRKLVMAPTHLRERTLKLIERETRRAESGQPAAVRAKMNSLVDPAVVEALYAASRAGVQISLNVRGICVLRPGVKGLSEHIRVVSIVGRFLEHARVFHFHNGGEDEVYLSSADWMPRNLDKRIELMFPVESPECRKKVLDALDTLFADNVKSRRLVSDGTWKVPARHASEPIVNAQLALYEQARRSWERRQEATPLTLEPLRPQ